MCRVQFGMVRTFSAQWLRNQSPDPAEASYFRRNAHFVRITHRLFDLRRRDATFLIPMRVKWAKSPIW